MDEEVPAAEPAAAAPPKPKRKGGFKRLLILLVPLLAIGGGAWFFLAGGSKTAQAEGARIEERGMVPFETFLVNLSDPGGNRFLKITLQLAFGSEGEAKAIADSAAVMGHLRSTILELLTEQVAQALVTSEGKTKLREQIKAKVAPLLKSYKVLDVLFSEFVVQF